MPLLRRCVRMMMPLLVVLLLQLLRTAEAASRWHRPRIVVSGPRIGERPRQDQHQHRRGGWFGRKRRTRYSGGDGVIPGSHLPRGGAGTDNSGTTASDVATDAALPPVLGTDPGSKTVGALLRDWYRGSAPPGFLDGGSGDGTTAAGNIDDIGIGAVVDRHLAGGLTEEEAVVLRGVYGPNAVAEPPRTSWLELIAEQFEDKLVRILVGVAVLSAVLEAGSGSGGAAAAEAISESVWHRFAEPLVICFLLVVNASVGVWQSRSAGNSLEALKAMQPSTCTVLRPRRNESGGAPVEVSDVPSEDLVPGDLIVLRTGDRVPADARLVRYHNGRRSLTVDETCLTGESVPVEKLVGTEGLVSPPENQNNGNAAAPIQSQIGTVFAGTTVVSGAGIALVVATGSSTEFGTIRKGVLAAKTENPAANKTPLTRQLDAFGDQLTGLIGGICAMVWIASLPKILAPSGGVFSSPLEGMVYYAKVAVALGVAAIPEGLPAVITLCLSLGTRRMAQRNVIVRNLPSVETLGCVSVICSDKTGTLTTNEMTVTSLVVLEQPNQQQQQQQQQEDTNEEKQKKQRTVEYTVEGVSYSPVGRIPGLSDRRPVKASSSSSLSDVLAVSTLCNDATIVGHDTGGGGGDDEDGATTTTRTFERNGEPTEAALCVLAEKLGTVLDGNVDGESENDDDEKKKPSEVASYHVDRWREEHPKSATLEFHRERKSEFR